jgi:hypothetical protein
MNDSKKANRRLFLKGAAGASLALPFLPSLAARLGHAQAVATKKRVIFIYMPHQETDGFAPDANFSFASSYLSPVATNYSARMLVMNNMKTLGQGHAGGHTEWLTGFPGGDDYRPTQGPSLDVYMSNKLQGQTPLPLINFSMSWRTVINNGVTSWNPGPTPTAVPAINNPPEAFSSVFTGGSSGTPAQPSQALVLQGSLLDALQKDYQRVDGLLSAGDRILLDQHLSLIRDQETRLQNAIAHPFSCAAGGGAPAMNLSWQDTLRSFMDSIVGAFRCDATRIATLQLGCSGDDSNYTFVNPAATNYHDNVAHASPELVAEVRKWQMQQIAYLCDQLAAVPDGAGGTLLDSTLIACLPELGWFPASGVLAYIDSTGRMQTTDNNHLRFQVPAVLIGSSGGFFKTGRFVDMMQTHYHDLLITLAHAMDFTEVTTWGTNGTGVLSQLLA